MNKTKTNFIYNSAYQIFSIIVPIILAPYLSRSLGVDSVGVYSYTYSIAYYFVLFAMLGVNNYGSRTIAKCKNDKIKMSQKFCEIYLIQACLGVLALVIYGVLCGVVPEYREVFLIQGLLVASSIFDVNWFFYGLEEFKVTAVRSLIVRVVNFVLILLFVKTSSDLWIYTLIMAATTLINQLVLWPFVLKRVYFSMPDIKKIKRHLKPLCILFIPVIAVSLYKIMDKIMLGALSNMDEVGLYEYAEKINSIPLVVIAALGTVMLPRISSIAHDDSAVKNYFFKASKFVLFLTVPLFFVFLLAAPTIVPLYLGEGFAGTAVLTILLSFSLPFVSFANVARTQYLIPMEKDKIYVFSVLIGAILNLVVNFLLIPFVGAMGACIGTLVSEISVMAFQTAFVSKYVKISKIFLPWVNYFVKSACIYLLCLVFELFGFDKKIVMIIQMIVFAFLYGGLNWNYIVKIIRKEKRS